MASPLYQRERENRIETDMGWSGVCWERELAVIVYAFRGDEVSNVVNNTVPGLADSPKASKVSHRYDTEDLSEKFVGLEDCSTGCMIAVLISDMAF